MTRRCSNVVGTDPARRLRLEAAVPVVVGVL